MKYKSDLQPHYGALRRKQQMLKVYLNFVVSVRGILIMKMAYYYIMLYFE